MNIVSSLDNLSFYSPISKGIPYYSNYRPKCKNIFIHTLKDNEKILIKK